MDILQDAYKGSNGSAQPENDFLLSTQQKSFECIVKAPYHSFNTHNGSRSIESPYTSLGSGRSSYVSIKPGSYNSLRARSVRANEQHESKSKAVMQALQNLQQKINTLEVDRAKAEGNLKTLALETTEYKEILKQKQNLSSTIESPCSPKRDSYSEELENQLENAQGRCEVLEKQLEYMRKVMQDQNPPRPATSPKTPRHTMHSTAASANSTLNNIPPLQHDFRQSSISRTQKATPVAASRLKPVQESPALEKLNGLEKEHLKLSASQSQAECKIRELEEKIREESHCRKLLEDKANELEQVVAQSQPMNYSGKMTLEQKTRRPKKKKVKKKVASEKPIITSSSSSSKHTTPRSPRRHQASPTSPNHYLLDLANIPFVVGQSTSRSHSVGANVQNVLSLMKSHSKLCGGGDIHVEQPSPREACKSRSPRTQIDMGNLLNTLTEEFEMLGDEHRLVTCRLEKEDSEILRKKHEHELNKLIEKMETKAKQITTIREILKSNTNLKNHRPSQSHMHSNGRVTLGSQEIEVVTTIRAPNPKTKPSAIVETRAIKNLELLKNAKKLQYQLQKDDLKWE